MTFNPLTDEERSYFQATHRAIITFADLTTAGTAQTLTLAPLVAGNLVGLEFAYLKTAFASSNGAVTNLTFTVGDTGSTSRYLGSYETLAATPAPVKAGVNGNPYFYAFTAADTLETVATATGGNVNTMTAGELHLYFSLQNVPASNSSI